MKIISKATLVVLCICPFSAWAQGVAINTSGTQADPSAMLDVESNTKGFLPPRLTVAERNGISNPHPGLMIYNSDANCMEWWNGAGWYNACSGIVSFPNWNPGSVFCGGVPTTIVPVLNPSTGRTWMDRDLGALNVPSFTTDQSGYGDLYQWGRPSDGHQCRTSIVITNLSTVDQPGHPNFISTGTGDWRNPYNSSLWQGVSGINNPCPIGYRVPTEAELDFERVTWNTNNSNGAFASPLRFPLGGVRGYSNGSISHLNTQGSYWVSNVSGSPGLANRRLRIENTNSFFIFDGSGSGASIRCIMN
jgi:hypothetical protein